MSTERFGEIKINPDRMSDDELTQFAGHMGEARERADDNYWRAVEMLGERGLLDVVEIDGQLMLDVNGEGLET